MRFIYQQAASSEKPKGKQTVNSESNAATPWAMVISITKVRVAVMRLLSNMPVPLSDERNK